ncbi:MAG: secondary thiamine-phosphate synthase enzyme YjbQ [Syntrophobacteraceae bacterium]|jgi:secondary thiamine-phosphate synthase enzyme
MPQLQIYSETLLVSMETGPDIVNITPVLNDMLHRLGFETGLLCLFVLGSTGSVTTIEYEPGAVEDLRRAINSLAGPGASYEHEKAWHDGNGHSHVQAALLGPSVNVPIRGGKLVTGAWQQIVLINHDVRARERRVEATVIGTRSPGP